MQPQLGDLLKEFESASKRLQNLRRTLTPDAWADGLPIHHVRVVSPFNEKIRYNVFSALSILPRHQHRHLQQAEQAAGK